MEENYTGFEGLTITLKKRKLNINENNAKYINRMPDGDYLVLGHYDQMSVKYINNWWEWAPYHTEAISLNDAFVDKYNIKAYFPEAVKRQKYQEQGFDYAVWREDEKTYPFTVVSVVNITETYAKKILNDQKDVCDALSGIIRNCVKKNGFHDKWKHMHCAFFPTIGFSDFVLLFKTAELKSVLNILEDMKEEMEEGFACLSNAYTMIGFCDSGLDQLNQGQVGDIKLAIRFGLKEGVSVKQFHAYFDDQMSTYSQNDEAAKAAGRKNYRLLGDADFMIVSDIELKRVLPLYFYGSKPGLFHPAHPIFKEYIRSIQSEVRVDIDKKEAYLISQGRKHTDKEIERYREEFIQLVENLKHCLEKNRASERIAYGLQIVMKRFLQLLQTGHCYDMESIIGRAFYNLGKCVEQNINIISGQDEEMVYMQLQDMLSALNKFRDIIGGYLADMQRSDSLFLEGRSLSHPSIGSATKLLFFYNGYIDKVKKVLHPGFDDKHSFVVTSGGTDETQAIDLFAHLDPSDKNTYSVILLTVPESSLYDIRSCLFHVLHETLHFCGERKRENRLVYIIQAVCEFTAIVFRDLIQSTQGHLYNDVIKPLYPYMNTEEQGQVKKEILEVLNDQADGLKKNLNALMYQYLKEYLPEDMEREDYFSKLVYKNLYEALENIFGLQGENNKMKSDIYACFLDYRYNCAENISAILRKTDILYSNVNLMQSISADMSQRQKEGLEPDAKAMNFINFIIHLYFGIDVQRLIGGIHIDEDDADIELSDLLEVLQYLFKECYADCMASEILKLKPEHFILSFLTEAQNEQNAFLNETLSKLRIITDLRYLFSIQGKFSEPEKEQITAYAQKAHEKGLCGIDSKRLICWLEKIIDIEGQDERIDALIKPVMEYLDDCKKEWTTQGVFEQLTELRKLNGCSEMETSENTYQFLRSVVFNWISYAK